MRIWANGNFSCRLRRNHCLSLTSWKNVNLEPYLWYGRLSEIISSDLFVEQEIFLFTKRLLIVLQWLLEALKASYLTPSSDSTGTIKESGHISLICPRLLTEEVREMLNFKVCEGRARETPDSAPRPGGGGHRCHCPGQCLVMGEGLSAEPRKPIPSSCQLLGGLPVNIPGVLQWIIKWRKEGRCVICWVFRNRNVSHCSGDWTSEIRDSQGYFCALFPG